MSLARKSEALHHDLSIQDAQALKIMTQQFDVQGTPLLCFLFSVAIRRTVPCHIVTIHRTVIQRHNCYSHVVIFNLLRLEERDTTQTVTATQQATSAFSALLFGAQPLPLGLTVTCHVSLFNGKNLYHKLHIIMSSNTKINTIFFFVLNKLYLFLALKFCTKDVLSTFWSFRTA